MGDQKYRADVPTPQEDGATLWHAQWMGGRTLAKITNCRVDSLSGDWRATVYTTGEADTFFSIPAVCRLMGKRVKGYVTNDGEQLVFRHGYYA